MKFLKSLFKIFVVLYILLCAALYFVQDKVLFRPHKLAENHQFRAGEEVEIEVESGIFLNCIWAKEPNSKGVVLYLHGNRGSNRWCFRQSQMMAGSGYDIFMPDYRGYGKSDGENYSEDQLFGDIQKVYDFLKTKYDESNIIVTGYSLGSGMAAWLSANNQPQQLFLVAPYFSMVDMKNKHAWFTPDFLLKYPLTTNEYLAKVKCPISLFHGTNDHVIPFDSATRLAALFPEKVKLFTLKNEGHRGAIFNAIFRNRFKELVE